MVSLGSVIGGTLLISWIINYYMQNGFLVSMIYAIPLSIVSGAIVIPSVVNFREERREFMIYEATFSDILGILFFYFTIESIHFENAGILVASVFLNIIVTVVASVVLSVLIIYSISRGFEPRLNCFCFYRTSRLVFGRETFPSFILDYYSGIRINT